VQRRQYALSTLVVNVSGPAWRVKWEGEVCSTIVRPLSVVAGRGL
jgi:hypothetical protein